MQYDVIIVGAGSAGCVMAARLSENPHRSVLLLDAGPDYGNDLDRWPADLVSGNTLVTSHDWGYRGESVGSADRLVIFRGKVIGGSSATNNVVALRGKRSDYNAWAQAGNPGWSFEDVLPFFRRLEHDLDIRDQWHGTEGPIPIGRHPYDQIIPVQRAFLESAQKVGHSWIEDHNAPDSVGVGRLPENVLEGVRQSTAFTYLSATRKRPNLIIRPNVLVDRIELEKGQAKSVLLANSGERISADQVVLSAGVYGSPAILLRSGIGPSNALRTLGIPVNCDLPAVGLNLQDHPLLWSQYRTQATPQSSGQPIRQTMLTLKSAPEQLGPDLQIFPSGPLETENGVFLNLLVGLMQPCSSGRLTIVNPDPTVPPSIVTGILHHPNDLLKLHAGLLHVRKIVGTGPLADLLEDEEWPGTHVQNIDDLAAAISEPSATLRFSSYQHGVGTCRMGPDRQNAVVNATGALHGIGGLHVVDASIMPSIPAANTNIPTIMLAERIAALW
jgi:choline dehydrogenase